MIGAVRNYIAVGAIAIAITLGGVAVFKYNSMSKLVESQTTEITELKVKLDKCKNSYDALELLTTQQNEGIRELEDKKEKLEELVNQSSERIASLRKQRDKALNELGKVPVPAGCSEKFDWMKDRAKEIING